MQHIKGLFSRFLQALFITSLFDIFIIWVLYGILVKLGIRDYIALTTSVVIILFAIIFFSAVSYIDTKCNELEYQTQKQQLPTTKNSQARSSQSRFSKGYTGPHPSAVSVQLRIEEAQKIENDVKQLLDSAEQTYPWLAKQVADFLYIHDKKIAYDLRHKSHPATKAAAQIDKIAKEKKVLQAKCKEQEYQLKYYETLFPWLEEFKQLSPSIGAQYVQSSDEVQNDEYTSLKDWLSPEEYITLPNTKKYQLALDRYKNRHKSDWEIGIEYERFVGYQYEKAGYKVCYYGALMGKQDMGRDLIITKDKSYLVVQCKRWSSEKEIHEKHIFQLYGSAVQLTVESGNNYSPVFVTSAKLSETAKKCAEYLSIMTLENYIYEDFPMIKCNISSSGEKIYHLPFDQQYDRVRIIPANGEVYVNTVAEAENLGFRRAWRWHNSEYVKNNSPHR